MRYRYAALEFGGSSTGTWNPEKFFCRYTAIEFVCNLSTVLNTVTLSPENVVPVYRHPICL